MIKEYLTQLEDINRRFCEDADNLRWQTSRGRFTNTNPNDPEDYWNIVKTPWFRSIKCSDSNIYVFPVDLDSDGLGPMVLKANHDLAIALYNITGKLPMTKASGSAGAHCYLRVQFPENFSEKYCLELMSNLAYTAYIEAKLSDQGFLIGKFKKDDVMKTHKGFVDMRLYQFSRMIRAFSVHPKSGLYSVPYSLNDSLALVTARMKLDEPPAYYPVPKVKYNKSWKLQKWEDVNIFELNKDEIGVQLKDMEKYVTRHKGDRWYRLLPDRLKAVCNMSGDIHHDYKVKLLRFMFYHFPLDKDQMRKWLKANAKWSDLDINSKTTKYQVNYQEQWVQNHEDWALYSGICGYGWPPVDKDCSDL